MATPGSNSTVVVLDVTPWPTVFWPFWIYVSLFLILSLTSIILFSISFLKYCSILISNGEVDIEAIREHHLNGSKRRSARQLLFKQRNSKNTTDQQSIDFIVALTNDYDFAVTFFKVKRKINCKCNTCHIHSNDFTMAHACLVFGNIYCYHLHLPAWIVPARHDINFYK